jgi:hypothetical protein
MTLASPFMLTSCHTTELAFEAKVTTTRLPDYWDDAAALPKNVIDHTVARFRQLHKDEKLRPVKSAKPQSGARPGRNC